MLLLLLPIPSLLVLLRLLVLLVLPVPKLPRLLRHALRHVSPPPHSGSMVKSVAASDRRRCAVVVACSWARVQDGRHSSAV